MSLSNAKRTVRLLAAAKDREQAQIMRDLMNKIGGIESDSNKR